jgi:mono/diheme cytochrome c family protein
MKLTELAARILIGALLVGAAGAPLWLWSRTPLIHARMAESGGWSPNVLQATVGLPLHLRLTSDDVMHGFAVGQMDMQSADIEPGKVTDVTLTFRKPGTYTFYCTRWCGINHWRMRGTIEVSGGQPAPSGDEVPLYVNLGLDLDAPHNSPVVPSSQPSALGGQQSTGEFPIAEFTSVDFYRSHSPYATWKELRAQPSLAKLDDQQVWDMVAFIWQSNTTPEAIAEGQRLYAQNCAACHGEGGASNGVFADQLAQASAAGGAEMGIQRPADFTDPARMLGASPALLEGKILRGGMGTGMPSWGPIFSEAQIRQIVSYLYTFQFKEYTK